MNTATTQQPQHYRRPGWLTRNVLNRWVAVATRCGISVWGSRVLEVPGRRTQRPRRVPVNLLTTDHQDYLVSARGNGEWVRNVRSNDHQFDLLLGRTRTAYQATELHDDDKTPVLRAYLRRWKAEVGAFFDGVDADSSNEAIRAIAHQHPVFVLTRNPEPTP